MYRSLIASAVLAALAAAPPVRASEAEHMGTTTAQGLANECRALVRFENGKRLNARARVGMFFCSGYFSGAFETLNETGQSLSCVPGEVNVGQRVRIFLDWADNNPALLHIHRANAVQLALVKAFPCPPAGTSQ